MSVRVAVAGATGRMGRAVLAAARERDDVVVACAVSRDPQAAAGADVPVADPADLPDALADCDPGVLVDFTVPEASVAYASACAGAGVALVVGTTGFDEGRLAALREASESVPVLQASNFARGVQALFRAIEEAGAALPGYDIEVTETHHSGKRDAPSGTAKALLGRIEGVRDDLDERVHGREGVTPRRPGEVGVHARRAGDVRGEHEVLLAGNDEVLTLSHRAESRGVFAAGALDAAVWLAGRDPGWYDFAEVVA